MISEIPLGSLYMKLREGKIVSGVGTFSGLTQDRKFFTAKFISS
jgi:hypothetical protein